MTYATLEEAWGPDFNKKKKSRRDKRQETLGKKIADETIDSEIILLNCFFIPTFISSKKYSLIFSFIFITIIFLTIQYYF